MFLLEGKLTRFVLLLVITFAVYVSPSASAATVELSAPIRTAFDKVVTAADSPTVVKLEASYKELGDLLKQDRESEAKIKARHYQNEEALIGLRKQIRLIDSDKLAKLTAQVTETKARYKPLFAQYTSLNKQISLVRPLKNKLLNSLMRAQADALKISTQLARLEIKNKETALKTAKAATALKIKNARSSLMAIDPLKVQIKASRSAASLPRKSLSPIWTNFKYAMKKSDAKSTLNSLATLVRLSRQIVDQQNKIHALEMKISDIITGTRARIL